MNTIINVFKNFITKILAVDTYTIVTYGFLFCFEFYLIMSGHYNFAIFLVLMIAFLELVVCNPKYKYLKDNLEKIF